MAAVELKTHTFIEYSEEIFPAFLTYVRTKEMEKNTEVV